MDFIDDILTEKLIKSFKTSISNEVSEKWIGYLKCVPAQKDDFGDYQCNAAMPLAKDLKNSPRSIAEKIISNLKNDIFDCSIAGPGFINLTLKPEYVFLKLKENYNSPLLGIPSPPKKLKYVLDYSSPNVAKPMHIGHIRSTIIGDSLNRILKELGHSIISDNHIGDWGTQFGKLIYGIKNFAKDVNLEENPMQKLLDIYVTFEKLEKENSSLGDEARAELVKLQNGDTDNTKIWKKIVELSLEEWENVYNRLDIRFDFTYGESFYHPMLKDTVNDMLDNKIAKVDDGAVCIFFPEETGYSPSIIRKKDGGYLYATTDIATIQYRIKNWKPDYILYITDDRQSLHFKQLFYTINNYLKLNISLEHIPFGLIKLAEGNISTREGRIIELSKLLDEGKDRAFKLITEKKPDMDNTQKEKIADTISTGAIKYNDLSQKRESIVLFDWDKMLSFDGNTAPYLQYTCARIKSIFEKGNIEIDKLEFPDTLPELTEYDIKLAKLLLYYPENVRNVITNYYPHILCEYLYKLANLFHKFYTESPVLKSDEPIRTIRLLLCSMTLKVMTRGLNLLGIKTIYPM